MADADERKRLGNRWWTRHQEVSARARPSHAEKKTIRSDPSPVPSSRRGMPICHGSPNRTGPAGEHTPTPRPAVAEGTARRELGDGEGREQRGARASKRGALLSLFTETPPQWRPRHGFCKGAHGLDVRLENDARAQARPGGGQRHSRWGRRGESKQAGGGHGRAWPLAAAACAGGGARNHLVGCRRADGRVPVFR